MECWSVSPFCFLWLLLVHDQEASIFLCTFMTLCFWRLWFSPLSRLSSCTTVLTAFPWWVELANSQDKLDRDVWTWSWEPVQCRGPRHQLLLQCWNVLRSAELLLALCPGSLVLSLHSCFSLTNSLLVPPLGISGPFLRQLWLTVVQYSNLQSRDFKRFHLYFLKKKMALLNCFEIQCTTILWQVKSNNKKASMPCF